MDGFPTTALPAPMPAAPSMPGNAPQPPPGVFMPPGSQQQMPRQAPGGGAVGRPSADPEQQAEREVRADTKRRMGKVLPKEMTDPRIAIYKLIGKRGMAKANGNRAVHTILLSDLEKAIEQGTDPSEYIRNSLQEKFPEAEGRFLWEAQDHKGNKMSDYGQHEIVLGDEDPLDDQDDDLDEEIREQLATTGRYGDPNRPLPPPGPAPDLGTHVKHIRGIVEDQYRRQENSSSTLIQIMMQQAEDRRREDQMRMEREERRREAEELRRREEEAKKEERRREEAREREKAEERREEREREHRRQEREQQMHFMKIIMETSNKPPPEDKMTPLLFKMLDSKSDRDGTKELFGMFNEASKQSMLMQGEASKTMLTAQAQSMQALISNILGMSKQMVEAQLEAQAPGNDDDPMDKIGRMFKIFAPAVAAIGKSGAPQQQFVQAQQQIPTQVTQVVQQAPPPQRQQGPATRKTHPNIPDNEWIKGSLNTIMQLGSGQIPPEKRFPALKWCAENLPEKMLAPIRAGNEEQVLAIGQEGADETFTGWFLADEANIEFLRGCVSDIQRMLAGAFNEESARASIAAHMAHLNRGQSQPFPEQQVQEAAAPEAPAPAEKGPRRAPPPQIAEPVAEAKTTTSPKVENGKPGNV